MPLKSICAVFTLILLTNCGPSGIGKIFFKVPFPTPLIDTSPNEAERKAMLVAFPPQIREATTVDGATEYTFVCPDLTNRANPIVLPANKVIEASGYSAFLDENHIKLVAYGMICPSTDSESRDTVLDEMWSMDNEPLEPPAKLGRGRSAFDDILTDYGFVIEAPTQFMFRLEHISWITQAARIPLGEDHGSVIHKEYMQGGRTRYYIKVYAQYLIPGPSEIMLDIWHGEQEVYSLPLMEGAKVDWPGNAICIGRLFNFPINVGSFGSNRFGPCVNIKRDSGEWKEANRAILGRMAYSPEWFSVTLEPDSFIIGAREFFLLRAESPFEDIKELKVHRFPYLTRLHFQLGEVNGLPENNRGVKNVLDLEYPYLHFRDWDMREQFLIRVLDDYYQRPQLNGPMPASPPETWQNATVRQILEKHYKKRWPLKSN